MKRQGAPEGYLDVLDDAPNEDDISRSYEFGKKALSQIKRLQCLAEPANYELWYTYASGHKSDMNKAINEYIHEHGHLTPEQQYEIHDTYLSNTSVVDKTESISGEVAKQIEEVLAGVNQSLGDTAKFSDNLSSVSSDLEGATSAADISEIVASLFKTTKEMEARSSELEQQLHQSKKKINELNENLETVRTESLTDALTTLGNRKRFDISIKSLIEKSEISSEVFSLLVADVDRFKSFNDTYGHQTGDQVLRLVGMTTKSNVKGRDIPCRYGGEEFAVLLPATKLKQAIKVAEDIRQSIMGKELIKKTTGENLGNVTISIGVVEFALGDNASSMVERADTCLYAAKHAGRNRVIHEKQLNESAQNELKAASD